MKQILWFRRDLRVQDNAILANGSGEVLPLFIFDKNILDKLPKKDKRVLFIYQAVLDLKQQLQNIGLDLAIFYGYPKEIFHKLLQKGFEEVLCSCDFDSYAIQRDIEIENLLPMRRFYDSFLIHPEESLKKDGTPYKVFTPFYKNLMPIWQSDKLELLSFSTSLKKIDFEYSVFPTLEELGFVAEELPEFLKKNPKEVLKEFQTKLSNYQEARDYFFVDGTSKLSVFLRFGTLSVRELFNTIKPLEKSEFFIRELFWREFYNTILYHFPQSEFENFNQKEISWSQNQENFQAWCEGNTGVPIVDAAMLHLNQTGLMHNRLRMIVASFLTKNLFLPWQWGEQYFASHLLDYEKSSNIGSWQWGASTGADSVPYFRVFNPYTQSEKFDKKGEFIQSVLPQLKGVNPKLFHKENGVQLNCFVHYPMAIVDIKSSREKAIQNFKES